MDSESVSGLMQRIRLGDQAAAAELVRQFEPEIRRKIRTWIRLRGADQRACFESMDICQSVMAIFFARARSESYDLERPEQLLALLTVMAQRRLRAHVRDGRRLKRDARRNRPLDSAAMPLRPAESPSRIVAGRELLSEFEARLSDQERRVAELRSSGVEWSEVAAELGGTPEARRKQWSRALARIGGRLGIEFGSSSRNRTP